MSLGYNDNVTEAPIEQFMSRDVAVAYPHTPLLEAAHTMAVNGFTGLPVVDNDRRVVGILTEYDLVTKGSTIHLPTFLNLMQHIDVYRKDSGLIKGELEKILQLKVGDVMNNDPLVLTADIRFSDAAHVFAEHHKVNPIPIVDAQRQLVGILSRSDIVQFLTGVRPHHPRHIKRSTYKASDSVEGYIKSFERDFVAVSRYRTRHWLLLSATFLIVGIIIATVFILNINISFGDPAQLQ
jgi:CBS domain-containing protein